MLLIAEGVARFCCFLLKSQRSVICHALGQGPATLSPFVSLLPSVRPSVRPSDRPSDRPSVCPTVRPSVRPSVRLSDRPTDRFFAQKNIKF